MRAAFDPDQRCGDAERTCGLAASGLDGLTARPARGRAGGTPPRSEADRRALAEVLVAPACAGRLDDVRASLAEVGITEQPLPHASAVRLAALRARMGLRMPGCCVLLAAEEVSAALATFDDRLAREAAAAGIEVLRS